MQAYQQKTEKFFVSEEKKFGRIDSRRKDVFEWNGNGFREVERIEANNRTVIKVSISPTLKVQIFRMNVRFGSFYYVHVTRKSCQNDVCTKNARALR
jgi:hypothetical protein